MCLLHFHYETSIFIHLQYAEPQSLIQHSEILSRMNSLEVKHGITVHYFKALCELGFHRIGFHLQLILNLS